MRRYLELLNLQLPESQLLTKKITQKTSITKVRKSLLSFMLKYKKPRFKMNETRQ